MLCTLNENYEDKELFVQKIENRNARYIGLKFFTYENNLCFKEFLTTSIQK